MTREEFIKKLEAKGYPYEIEGNKIVVIGGGVNLPNLTSLPPDVVFENGGSVYLYALTSIPPGVEFKNGGDVFLKSLTSISPGVEFKNEGNIWLGSLTGYFTKWKGNIEGIDSKRLLNSMIKRGMFI